MILSDVKNDIDRRAWIYRRLETINQPRSQDHVKFQVHLEHRRAFARTQFTFRRFLFFAPRDFIYFPSCRHAVAFNSLAVRDRNLFYRIRAFGKRSYIFRKTPEKFSTRASICDADSECPKNSVGDIANDSAFVKYCRSNMSAYTCNACRWKVPFYKYNSRYIRKYRRVNAKKLMRVLYCFSAICIVTYIARKHRDKFYRKRILSLFSTFSIQARGIDPPGFRRRGYALGKSNTSSAHYFHAVSCFVPSSFVYLFMWA